MLIADWLEAVDKRDPAAWRTLLVATARLARRRGAREPDDLASAFVLQQFERQARDARRADPATPLHQWLSGCVRHHIAREHRNRRPMFTVRDAVDTEAGEPGDATPFPDRGPGRRAELRRRIAERLSDAELAALDLHLAGCGSRTAAERLGIHRDSFRDRLERATRKLAQAAAPSPRIWALLAADSYREAGDGEMVWILVAYGQGGRLDAIARGAGRTYASVRDRIARVRARVRAAASAAAGMAPAAAAVAADPAA